VNDAKLLAAWDLRSGAPCESSKKRSGADYLEEAAKTVRRMQEEVKANFRNMYS